MADTPSDSTSNSTMPSPLQCLIGSLIAAAIAYGAYNLMHAIALSFASKPIQSSNITVVNITVAVRTLVVGITALATGVTSLASVGLFGLGIQLLLRKSNDSAAE
ncbi:MAG: DUF3082 domain-containing protein [Myxacorys chilensis ATA2-1-KO14]|nr:DUF3082 domain-containing protein [Myxacorys chilensis ATA2-1-KO14]